MTTGTFPPRAGFGACLFWRRLASDFHQSNWSTRPRFAAPTVLIAVVTFVCVAAEAVSSVRSIQETIFAGWPPAVLALL